MKRLVRSTQLIALGLLVLLATGCQGRPAPTPAPPSSAASVSSQASQLEAGRITALGTLLSARSIKLCFSTSGPVRVMKAHVGTEVKAGDVLAELDTTDLEMDIKEAKDELALNQALRAQAKAGAREGELAVVQAEYERAMAQHEGLLAGARPEEIAMAQADYQAALARYQGVQSGASEEELIAAAVGVEKAAVALQNAQAAYDAAAFQPGVGSSPQAVALQEATIDYQAAKAQYESLKKTPSEADLGEAQAQLDHAEAQLRLAQSGPTAQEVAVSAQSVTIAQAQLTLKEAGARPEDVAVAEARVVQARTALERAQLAFSRAQLLAPFDGTVSEVYLSPGEWGAPGVSVVELLDTTHWRVETHNVGELNIGRVRVGQEARVRVIAFRDVELQGHVITISPVAVVQQGDTTYTLLIEVEATDLNLRPGMNVEVEILTE